MKVLLSLLFLMLALFIAPFMRLQPSAFAATVVLPISKYAISALQWVPSQTMRLHDATWYTASYSALGRSIAHIIELRTDKQMAWIATTWIIAIVTNILAVRNWAVRKFICEAVGQHLTTIFQGATTNTNHSITVRQFISRPRPTFVFGGTNNMFPKTLGNRLWFWPAHCLTSL